MRKIPKPPTPEPDNTPYLIGYARVSTLEQRLDLQLDALRAAGVKEDNLHVEKVSATSRKRPALDLAIMDLRPGDTLVVWRLDRIARNMKDLYDRLDKVKEAGASFKSLTENFDFTSASGQLILGFLGLMAQFERQLTIERTKAGMRALADRGFILGAPKMMTPDMIKKAMALIRKPGGSVKKAAEKLDVAVSSIYGHIVVKKVKGKYVLKLKQRKPQAK